MVKRISIGSSLVIALLVAADLIGAAGSLTPAAASSRPGGGSEPIAYTILVHPSGSWEGEATLPADLAAPLAASLQAHAIRTAQEEAGSQDSARTLLLQGDDPRAIVEAILGAGCADGRLEGPVALHLSGFLRAGESFSIGLPANPSTGYAWTQERARETPLYLTGDTATRLAPSRLGAPDGQTLRFTVTGTGQAELNLVYRRAWERTSPVQIVSIRSDDLDLSGLSTALGQSPSAATVEERTEETPLTPGFDAASSTLSLPASFNWCTQEGCTAVRDQESCGSCWAFATVGVMESALRIAQDLTTDLSEQYLVSCNTDGYGCDGGWWAHDYHLNKKPPSESQAGTVLESAFPYRASDVPCNGPYQHPYRLSSWGYVGSSWGVPSVSAIKQAIYDHGPVAAAVCVGNAFQGYSGGVFQTNETCSGSVNHAIVLVGWDDSQQVWILRNSWGSGWGEGGYMRIRYGTSMVGYSATYVAVTSSAPTPTPTPIKPTDWVYLPIVTRNYGTSSTPLINGDFELGRDGSWDEYSSNGWALVLDASDLPVFPHGGSWAAWLGGDNDETSVVSQWMTVPSNATTLDYWLWISSEDWCGYDDAYVQFGSSTLRSYALCASNDTWGWTLQHVDVVDWRGQTVELRFVVETDGSLNSNLFLDDVSIATGTSAAEPILSTSPQAPAAADATIAKAAQ